MLFFHNQFHFRQIWFCNKCCGSLLWCGSWHSMIGCFVINIFGLESYKIYRKFKHKIWWNYLIYLIFINWRYDTLLYMYIFIDIWYTIYSIIWALPILGFIKYIILLCILNLLFMHNYINIQYWEVNRKMAKMNTRNREIEKWLNSQ